MPRLPRVSIQGVLYYVTSRAPERHKLFQDSEDTLAYIDLLARARKSHVMSLFAYTLLPNHVHLLIELGPGANISDIMQSVNNAYTKYFNSKYHRKGSVFHGRYDVTYVEKAPYLVRLTRHVHMNAVASRMTDEPGTYPYDSCGAYLTPDGASTTGNGPDVSDEVKEVRGLLEGAGPAAYRAALAQDGGERELHAGLHHGGFLGSDQFVAWMKNEVGVNASAKKDTDVLPANVLVERAAEVVRPDAVGLRRTGVRKGFLIGATAAILLTGGAGLVAYRMVDARMDAERLAMEAAEEDLERYERLLRERDEELRRRERELAAREANGFGGPAMVHITAPQSIDGSIWTITVTPGAGSRSGAVKDDVLTFRDGTITSRRMTGEGFPTSNYTITRRDSRMIRWETMQTGRDGSSAHWRGEVHKNEKHKDEMGGMMFLKNPDGTIEGTFSFISKKVEFPL